MPRGYGFGIVRRARNCLHVRRWLESRSFPARVGGCTLQVPTTIASADNFPSGYWSGRIVYNELVDWNGDGILDTNGQTSTTTKPDLLTRITLPTGGTKEVGYTFSAQQASVNPNLAFPMLLVASTTNNDGFRTRDTTLYTYEGGKMYLAGDVRDRRFAGFEKITKQDALGSTQTYYHRGDTASTTTGELTDSFPLLGKPYREDVLSTSDSTLKKTFYRWNAADLTSVSTSSANSHSVDLERTSSQCASISDMSQSGLDLSNNLTAALWVKLESLPTGGNVDSFVMKRVASGSQRSYSSCSYNSLSLDTQYDGLNASCSLNVSRSPSTGSGYHVAVTKSGTRRIQSGRRRCLPTAPRGSPSAGRE